MFMAIYKLIGILSKKKTSCGRKSPLYTEGNSLAIYFEDSQFRRNRTFHFIVSKYMLTNVHVYDDINRLTLHIM